MANKNTHAVDVDPAILKTAQTEWEAFGKISKIVTACVIGVLALMALFLLS